MGPRSLPFTRDLSQIDTHEFKGRVRPLVLGAQYRHLMICAVWLISSLLVGTLIWGQPVDGVKDGLVRSARANKREEAVK